MPGMHTVTCGHVVLVKVKNQHPSDIMWLLSDTNTNTKFAPASYSRGPGFYIYWQTVISIKLLIILDKQIQLY